MPSDPGVHEYSITSDDLFSLKQSPGASLELMEIELELREKKFCSHESGRTLCVGAGYIALECGGFLTHLGYDVTISVRSVPMRTGGFDRDAVNKVVTLMEKTGTRFLHGSVKINRL